MAGLRDRLREKKRRTAEVPIVINPDEEASSRKALADAELQLFIAENSDETATKKRTAVTKAKTEVENAKARYESAVVRVKFQSIPRPDFEALIAAHPSKKDDEVWDVKTFRPALIAACSVDSAMTEEEWVDFLDSPEMSIGEIGALYEAVLTLNYEVPQSGIPLD